MRLLKLDNRGELCLTKNFIDDAPSYAILSHTWGTDEDEVTFNDLENGSGKSKVGYAKIQFCGKQARKDSIEHFWVDTCCINKANHAELSEAITSMFRWYRNAVKCYVYLPDVSVCAHENNGKTQRTWESAFRISRWFTRGWTLQELLAPKSVEFFSREEELLGNKDMLEKQINEITGIPTTALHGSPLSHFPVEERMRWAAKRDTKRKEDKAYCLLGIFEVFMPLMYGEGENAFSRLKEEINKRSGETNIAMVVPGTRLTSLGFSEPPAHAYWMVTRSTNALFTGREDLLQKLDGIVRDAVKAPRDQAQCRIVISGMGGQGKSEICLQLACRLQRIFWGVFWIDVNTTDQAERSFLEVAQKLSIPAQTWEDARLGIANLKRPWLLVLDNADNPDVDYQHYFPSGTLGVVMLTSRNEECNQYATEKYIALDGLADGEARELLLRATHVPRDQHQALEDDAQVVASLLRSHPLALIQAGSYVARGHCTLAEYPRLFEHQRKRLLAFRPAQAQSRYRDVYATFEASADILQSSHTESAGDALQLLPVLATCGPSRLPLSLFEAGWKGAQTISPSQAGDGDADRLTPWHVSRLPSLIQADVDAWDSFRLVEAIQVLKAFALVSTDTYDGFLSVSMHPLIHAWARDRIDATRQHESWLTTGCLIAVSSYEREFWRTHGRQLQPHLQALTSWEMSRIFASEPPMMITCILMRCGWLLRDMRDDAKLFVLLNNLSTHLSLDRRTVDGKWLNLYDLTARNLVDNGKNKGAVILLEQVVKIQEQTLMEHHLSRLTSQHELAIAYQANGQVKEAVSLLEQVVKIKEQTLAEDHPDRLASQHALAISYRANGQVKKAVSLLEQVVKIQEQTLAEDHPLRLASQHELASAYQANGQVKEAVSLLEQVVKIEEQTLAEDHPLRLVSQQVLATMFWDLGRRNTSLQMMKHVVEMQGQMLDKHHTDRTNSEAWLNYIEDEMYKLEPA